MKYSYILLIGLLFIAGNVFSQGKIKILNADKQVGSGGKDIFTGNVAFQQNQFIVRCDKVVITRETRVCDAIGNIHVTQGESINIYSETLTYDGNTQMGKFRRNVKLVDDSMTLTTEYLDFNAKDNSGYFYNGGHVVDSTGTLESKSGYYYPKDRMYFFKDSVVVKNDDYTLYSDTLKYNIDNKIAFVHGPTEIVSDSSYLYCENGWYDMENDIAQFSENAYLKNNRQRLSGDSLYYDQNKGIGRAFENIVLYDSVENVVIRGNYGEYHESPENALVTDSALFIHIHEGDSLFLHADTLYSHYDSTGAYQILKAFHRAKIYRFNLQAQSDSIVYSFEDSVINMYKKPVVWSEEHQITAEHIKLHTRQNTPDYIEILNSAFIVSQEDTVYFNQIKGNKMIGYFRDNVLYRVDVKQDGKSLYFVSDEQDIIGVNKSQSPEMNIFIKDNKPVRIVFGQKPTATLHPLRELSDNDLKLSDFIWLENHRPYTKDDIFLWIEEVFTSEDRQENKVEQEEDTEEVSPKE